MLESLCCFLRSLACVTLCSLYACSVIKFITSLFSRLSLHAHIYMPMLFLFCQALREHEKDSDDCLSKTTLTMHFFGSRGTGQLTLKQFSKYVIKQVR